MPLFIEVRKFRPAKKPRRTLVWTLLVLAAVFSAWMWWRSKTTTRASSPEPGAAAQETNTPRAPFPAIKNATVSRPEVGTASGQNPVLNASGEPRRPAEEKPRILEAQLALARRGISPGSIDDVFGAQTQAALRAFQRQENLPATGAWDAATQARLPLEAPFFTDYIVTAADLARLKPLGATWLAKSEQGRLDYESILELVAEKGRASPNLIRLLNPGLDWSNVSAGTSVRIPAVETPAVAEKAAFVTIRLADRLLQAFDANTNLLAHFPCSIGQRMDKRPVGELHVAVVAPDPNYTFDPEVFPESAEGRELGRKLILQPGPNNPVGTVWIGLDKPGYGIHGTPRPEQVGRTESHGCFRLANWNAEHLLKLVWVGMPVYVEP